MFYQVISLVLLLGFSAAWDISFQKSTKTKYVGTHPLEPCQQCDYTKCTIPTECKAGLVLDRCGCCRVCGLEESHLCNLEEEIALLSRGRSLVPWHGRCGRNLECRTRTDVDPKVVRKQNICYCLEPGLVCGTDGKTYTHCELEAEQALSNRTLEKMSDGPCRVKPKAELRVAGGLVKRGEKFTLVCEAVGYPRADVTWHLSKPGDQGISRKMPGDFEDVTVTTRGAKFENQVISFLQITDFKLDQEGDYRCVADNELGVDTATATLVLVN
ncbi:Insulin-like growth factor-binding protein- protein 1 [Clonorchis sinensis]|uniref:Insulin-like growth factor-binding protein-protein 1 n=1 Tax=Clonorchis sinensis TaxID=79923 RepID=A0A3R7D6C5_CLOSI|nr:Insulin-like growth factor-binding protein- protein 1 [Clonorchis sinensis]